MVRLNDLLRLRHVPEDAGDLVVVVEKLTDGEHQVGCDLFVGERLERGDGVEARSRSGIRADERIEGCGGVADPPP